MNRMECVRMSVEEGQKSVSESECDNTADSVWNDIDDDGVVDEEEKKE